MPLCFSENPSILSINPYTSRIKPVGDGHFILLLQAKEVEIARLRQSEDTQGRIWEWERIESLTNCRLDRWHSIELHELKETLIQARVHPIFKVHQRWSKYYIYIYTLASCWHHAGASIKVHNADVNTSKIWADTIIIINYKQTMAIQLTASFLVTALEMIEAASSPLQALSWSWHSQVCEIFLPTSTPTGPT